MFNKVPFILLVYSINPNICSGIPSANTFYMLLSATHIVISKFLYILSLFQEIRDFHEDFNDVLAD
jgi:hypothetical protein